MRRLNVKFLICLIVPLVLIAGGVHLLWAINVDRSSKIFLGKAERYVEEGDPRQALKHYAQYLARNPDDTDQVCTAAMIAADVVDDAAGDPSAHDVRTAYELMSRALRKVPERQDIRYRLADLLVKIGYFDEARRNIKQLEAAGELDSQMQFNYAVALAKIDKIDDAVERLNRVVGYDSRERIFDQRVASDASLHKAYLVLALLLRNKRDNQPLADRVMDQLVMANPETVEAHVLLGRYLRETKGDVDQTQRPARLKRAHDHLRRAYALAPTDLDVLLENAVLALGDEDYAAAEKFLEIARIEHPQDHRVYGLKGRIAILQKDIEGAIREYEVGLQQIPDNLDLIWYLFESQLQMNDLASAQATIERMKKLEFPRVRLELAEAQLPFLQEKWLESSQRLEEVRPQLAGNPGMALNVNLLLARCYGKLGQTDKELEAYQRALQINGSSLPAARGMISVLMRLQQYEQAYRWLQGLRRALGDEEFAKDRELASAFYQVVLVLQRQRPGNRGIASDVELARKLMHQAVGEGRSSETLLATDRLLKDKDLGRAAARLREALRKQPDDERLQRTYLRVVIKQKGPAAGLKLLDTAQNAVRGGWKDTAHFRIVKSQLLTTVADPEVRAKLAALEIGIDQFSQSDQFQLWRALGAAYYSLSPRGFESAQRCWENAATLRPTELDLVHLLFDLSRERSDELGLAATMDLVQKTFGPASPEADYFRALKLIGNYRRDLTDRSDLDEAAVIAEGLAKRRPTWNWVALLQAQVSDLQGQPQGAILEYQRALELGPVRPAAVRRLVELLMADARYQEARIALGHLNPVPKEMLRYKVLLEAMGGDRQRALSALSDAIDIDSLNPDDFLWKGRVLNQLQKPDDATKAFFRAVQLDPNLPQAWLTLIEHLVRNGRSRDAENFARQAENHLATDRAPLVLGQAYALLGNYSLAEQYYQTALAAAPEDPILGRSVAAYYLATDQRPQAERQLKKILQLTDSSQPSRSTHAVWARRMLAQVLAKDGGYLRFRTALALLDTNRVAGELGEMDQRIKAELLGARVEPDFRQEALRILESLQDGAKPLSLQQRMLLARLYDQRGRWNQARNLMIDLVSENPENADLLANLSEMLLNRQEVDLSGRWTDKLAQIEPSSYRTLRLRALVLSASRENEEAMKLIDAWLPKPLKPSDANQVLQVATLLEELKYPRAAEQKFTTFDKFSSGRSLALARFLARQGHLDQAFQLAANRVNNENVRDVARLAIFAITQYPLQVTDAHFEQARKWYEQALAKSSNDLSLKLNWSSVLAVLGKSEQAESILKKALDGDLTTQQKGIVINNLAYLRALRGATDADALRLVDTAAKLIGPHPSVLDSLAMIHLSQGHCSRAIEQLEEATRFGVDSGLYYFHLALAHQCASDRSSAQQALEEAERLGFSRQQLGVGEQQRYQQLESWLAL